MPTINEYIDQLKEDRSDLVDNLETQGITGLTGDETFTQLVPQVLNISGGGEGQIIQYDVMPTPSAELEDKIIQYTGATDSTYTNGYFYKCESDHTALPEYSWVVIPVQDTPTYRYYVCGTYLVYNVTPDNYSIAPDSTTPITTTYLPTAEVGQALSLAYGLNKNLLLNVYSTQAGGTVGFRFTDTITAYGSNTITGNAFTTNGNGNTWLTQLSITYNNTFSVSAITCTGSTQKTIGKNNTNTYEPTADSYNPATTKYVDNAIKPVSVSSADSTYTIASLVGSYSYKLSEITALTITASTASDLESIIYFTSGSTPTSVSLPDSITNLGDAPTMTTASNVNTGTCEASKNYIISILNNIAIWKAY